MFIGIALALAFATGLPVMLITRKFRRSFLLSLAANTIVMMFASIWWVQTTTEPFRYTLGKLFFYGIAYVNIEIMVVFLLVSLRKPPTADPETKP
jgi:uncharacterized membrane protein YedE/YeeE